MKQYKLVLEALEDLEHIADWGWEHWGEERAYLFIQSFYDRFEWLVEHYELGRKREDVHATNKEIRSWVHEKHVIFYQVLDSHIEILGILHSKQDVLKRFEIPSER